MAEPVYNAHMRTFANRVRATASRPRDHIDTISIRPGDVVGVGPRNQQHPAFVWCATEDGHHGSVPEEYIEIVDPGAAIAWRDYDSSHLTATAGETLEVLEEVGDFLRCRNAAGIEGWVPVSGVEDVEGRE